MTGVRATKVCVWTTSTKYLPLNFLDVTMARRDNAPPQSEESNDVLFGIHSHDAEEHGVSWAVGRR